MMMPNMGTKQNTSRNATPIQAKTCKVNCALNLFQLPLDSFFTFVSVANAVPPYYN